MSSDELQCEDDDAGRTVGSIRTRDDFGRTYEGAKNWGKWGRDDVLGTLNYITGEKVASAAKLIRSGRRVSMSLPIGKSADNTRPPFHSMRKMHELDAGTSFATDFIGLDIHGDCMSHIDALCHVSYDGLMYNGRSAAEVTTDNRVMDVADYGEFGIVGRGVLLDVPGFRGVPWLEPGESVGRDELERIERHAGLTVGEGDLVAFRTGHLSRRRSLGPWDDSPSGEGRAGLTIDGALWLNDRHVAAFLPDGDGETVPWPIDGVRAPIHALQVSAMGMAAADNLDLEQLADACRSESRWEFFIVIAPWTLDGGTGSLINPVAIL